MHRRRQHGDCSKGPKRTRATVKHETAPPKYLPARSSSQENVSSGGVARFFKTISKAGRLSAAASKWKTQLDKDRGKLFTFLSHDGVPWNNNTLSMRSKRLPGSAVPSKVSRRRKELKNTSSS